MGSAKRQAAVHTLRTGSSADSMRRTAIDGAGVATDLVVHLPALEGEVSDPGAGPQRLPAPRIGVLIVAYNAASTLAGVLDRIPSSFRPRISKVFVCDDHSNDSTYLVGIGYQQV